MLEVAPVLSDHQYTMTNSPDAISGQIVPYTPSLHPRILEVWESSVRSTHTFLDPDDIVFFRSVLSSVDFSDLQTFCFRLRLPLDDSIARTPDADIVGFLAASHGKLEMLFISPQHLKRGYGRKMLAFAVETLGVTAVDVNEQNGNAVKFYEANGFVVFERRDLDDTGKPYPILGMRLRDQHTPC